MPAEAHPGQWIVIVNPRAGNGTVSKAWPSLETELRRHLGAFSIQWTDAPLHAIELVQEAVARGCRRILAVGGDGTNHEVVNGIIRQQTCPSTDIIYGLIPIGTGNDWRRTYRIPKNYRKWAPQLARKRTVLQDVGKLTYRSDGETRVRYFVNVAGLAYDGFVTRYVNENPVSNKLGYLAAVFRCLLQYELKKARITADGLHIENRCYTINAGICRFSGGGMRLVPHARPDDHRLALTVAGPVSRLGVLLNTPRFFNGHLGRHPKVDLYQVERLRVTSLGEQPILLEADGEFLGHTPVEIEIRPHALRVLVPEWYHAG